MKLLKIKLKRINSWKIPIYNVIVINKNTNLKGSYYEKLGFYSPCTKNKIFYINFERLGYWLYKGAMLTNKVGFLISKIYFFRN